jgi:apolipoprotein N-acyltransferase
VLRPLAVCAAAGAALALCLPAPGLTFLAWLAPAVLLAALSGAGRRGAFLLGWAFGAAYCAISLHWIYLTCRFAGVDRPASFIAWLALCSLLGVNACAFAAAARAVCPSIPRAAWPWAWAALWAAVESAGARWMGWRPAPDLLAYTQWRHPVLLQGISVFGPHALGFLILLANGALLSAARRERGWRGNCAAASVLLALWCGYGIRCLERRSPPGPRVFRVAILQPCIDQYRKFDPASAGDIRGVFDGLLSPPGAARADLVLWPESSLPGFFDDPGNAPWVFRWARRLGEDMIVGAVLRRGERMFSSAVLVGAGGRPAGAYFKRRLVPFGEFVPFRPLLQRWVGILAEMGDFSPGRLCQDLFRTRLGVTGASLCYEAVFPRFARIDASRGARVLVNLTNDGWYKDTWGPRQHFWVNAFRAVENRATVLRAANTGISGAFDPYGVVLSSGGLMTRERLEVLVPLEDPFPRGSLHARRGDWFGALCLAASAALGLWAAAGKLKKI